MGLTIETTCARVNTIPNPRVRRGTVRISHLKRALFEPTQPPRRHSAAAKALEGVCVSYAGCIFIVFKPPELRVKFSLRHMSSLAMFSFDGIVLERQLQ